MGDADETSEARAAARAVQTRTGAAWLRGRPRAVLRALVAEHGLPAVLAAVAAEPVPPDRHPAALIDAVADRLAAAAHGVDPDAAPGELEPARPAAAPAGSQPYASGPTIVGCPRCSGPAELYGPIVRCLEGDCGDGGRMSVHREGGRAWARPDDDGGELVELLELVGELGPFDPVPGQLEGGR